MKSIATKSMVSLTLHLLLALSLIFALLLHNAQGKFEDSWNTQLANTDAALKVALEEPVFTYDSGMVSKIIDAFIENPNVYSIKASDPGGMVLGEGTDEQVVEEKFLQSFTHELTRNDELIGQFQIVYRNDHSESLITEIQITFAVVGLGVLFVILFTNWLTLKNKVLMPLNRVGDAMKEIASGDGNLTLRIESKGSDEIAQLAGDFNTFVEKLQNLVISTKATSSELMQRSTVLTDSSVQQSTLIVNQKSELEQASTALSQMTSTTSEIAHSASETALQTQKCNELAGQGKHHIENTVEQVDLLSENMVDTSNRMNELSAKTETIANVLTVIKGIAEQTNLLALNAAIEAARAGEQGRGFAVVADEVRSLAKRTQDSTTEIESIILELQQSSESLVESMTVSEEALQNTLTVSSELTVTLEDIFQSISLVSDMNTQIATASEEQHSVVRDVSDNVQSIFGLSEEAANEAENVGSVTTNMVEHCIELDATLDRFKVKNQG